MQRWIRIFAPTLALAVVLTAGVAALGNAQASAHPAASASAQAQPTPTEEPASATDTDTVEQQDGPQNEADGAEAPEANGAQDEAAETAKLAASATISEQQASSTALAANPGATVAKVSLDDENGTVVYSVELSSGAEVKVDATNGQIVDTKQDGEQDGEANDAPTATAQP